MGRRWQIARQSAEKGRFSRAVRTEHDPVFAGINVPGNTAEDRVVAPLHAEVLDGDERSGGGGRRGGGGGAVTFHGSSSDRCFSISAAGNAAWRGWKPRQR